MTQFGLLDHDMSNYKNIFNEIMEISRGWGAISDKQDRLLPLTTIWHGLQADPETNALPRALVAHLLADLQLDPAAELQWDLESLRSLTPVWEQTADPRLFNAACRSLPSIYLSLARAAFGCADRLAAQEYLRRARAILPILPSCPYTSKLASAISLFSAELTAEHAG